MQVDNPLSDLEATILEEEKKLLEESGEQTPEDEVEEEDVDLEEGEDEELVEEEPEKEPEPKSKEANMANMRKLLEKERENNQRILDDMAQLRRDMEAKLKPQEPEKKEEIPDPEIDREAYVDYELKQTKANQAQLDARLREQDFNRGVSEAQNDFRERGKAKGIDYDAIEASIIDNEVKKTLILNPGADENQVRSLVKRGIYIEAAKIYGNVKSADKVLDALVQYAEIAGYKAKEAEADKEPEKKLNIEKIKRNQEKGANMIGKSPRGKMGKPVAKEIGLKDIANFGSDEDFREYLESQMLDEE